MFAFQHQREFIYSAFSRWISLRFGSEGLQNALFIYFQGKANGLGGSFSGNEKSDGQREDGRFSIATHFKSAWPRRLSWCLISWNYTQALQFFSFILISPSLCVHNYTHMIHLSVQLFLLLFDSAFLCCKYTRYFNVFHGEMNLHNLTPLNISL